MEVIKIDGTTMCHINCDGDGVHIEYTLNARDKNDKTIKILTAEETVRECDCRLDMDFENAIRYLITMLSFLSPRGIRKVLRARRQLLRNTKKWEKQNAKSKRK